MSILIAGEESQTICKEFRKKGYEAFSCDLLPPSGGFPEWHYQCDIRELLTVKFDLVIFHPPCTFLCNSGVRWLYPIKENISRWEAMDKASDFFNLRHKFNSPLVCTENPVPHKYARFKIGDYSQLTQPWKFGERKLKGTCFWLKGLPPLVPTNIILPPKDKEERKKWAEVHRASPGPERSRIRSKTYLGIAEAVVAQWGPLIKK